MLFSVSEKKAGYSDDPEHLDFLYQMIMYFSNKYGKEDAFIEMRTYEHEVDIERFYEDDIDENGYLKNRAEYMLKNQIDSSAFTMKFTQKPTELSEDRYRYVRIEYSPINRVISVHIADGDSMFFGVGDYMKNIKQRKCVLALQALYRKVKTNERIIVEDSRFNKNINRVLGIFPDMQDSLLLIGSNDA